MVSTANGQATTTGLFYETRLVEAADFILRHGI
jgi:hypothetical protein